MLGWVGVKSGVRRHFESIKRIKVIFRVLLTEGEAHVHFHREVPADQGGLDVGDNVGLGPHGCYNGSSRRLYCAIQCEWGGNPSWLWEAMR
jgi:hypothetical protein